MKSVRWYIQIHGDEEGPYSFDELKKDYRVHAMLPVRREAKEKWVAAIDDPLLTKLFKEERPNPFPKEENRRLFPEEGEVIVARSEPPYHLFWALAALLFLSYLLYRYYL